jgi:CheY-like chemotaxis protein
MFDQKTILIADDEAFNFTLLKVVLNRIGKPTVLCADTGEQAISLCRQHPEIDLVLLDIQMPFGDGYEAYKAIREILPDVPIIAITAFAMADNKRKVLDAGFDMYTTKPISARTVEYILNTYLTPKPI